MENKNEFQLVKGVFSPEEAKEVLFKLINSKIKYHQLEMFSLAERNMGDEKNTDNRIQELESSKLEVENQIAQAKKDHKYIKIDGTIRLEFLDNI